MSWLLLDVGNTVLKWALLPAAGPWPSGAAAASGQDPAGQPLRGSQALDIPGLQARVAAELSQALAQAARHPAAPVSAASWGCAVAAADKVAAIEEAVRAAGWQGVEWLGAAARFDHDAIVLRNGYRDPLQLGADRWHALIGARARFARGALAVINAGTATTIDGLGEDGDFLGGVIAPGLELMRASLAQGTARLPLAAGDYVEHPDNTEDAIRTGILDAQLGLIDRRVRRIGERAGGAVQLVFSGGNGARLMALLQSQRRLGTMALEPDLVLLGLWHRARARAAEAISKPIP